MKTKGNAGRTMSKFIGAGLFDQIRFTDGMVSGWLLIMVRKAKRPHKRRENHNIPRPPKMHMRIFHHSH